VLAHCRGPGPHARGCWVVMASLGRREQKPVARRVGQARASRAPTHLPTANPGWPVGRRGEAPLDPPYRNRPARPRVLGR
jgi:hypothetical protein